jgi:predicted permease
MGAVFAGFATVGFIIATGIALAHFKVVDLAGQRTLAAITFNIASPALLLTMLADSDVDELFSGNLAATGGAVVVTAGLAALVARLRGHDLGRTVVGMLCSCYVNSANLGIPIAAYVLGDASLVAPTLLLQLVVLQPIALMLLDVAVAPGRVTVARALTRPLRNPMTIGSALGLVMAVTDVSLPDFVLDPLALLGDMSVPSMLLAYGIGLRLGPLPGRGVRVPELATVVGLKMVVQPTAAYVIGRVSGMDDAALLAVTVISALPTAQNVYVMAVRYQQATILARDGVFVSTLSAVPVVLAASALLA